MPIYKVNGNKKDGLQKYHVRINYISCDGKFKQLTRTAYGSEAAKDLEAKLQNDIKAKQVSSDSKKTIDKLFNEYIATKKHDVRKTTYLRYEQLYGLYIKPELEKVKIYKLTIPKLQEWKMYIEKLGIGLTTRNHAYAVLRILLNYAVKMEYIPKNPLIAIGCFKDATHEKTEMGYYTPEEFLQYISVARDYASKQQAECNSLFEWDFYVFFNIAFYTGLRKGEILALKWSDIDGEYITVSRSVNQKVRGGDVEGPPKSKSSNRTLQIPLPLISILDEHRSRQEENLCHFSGEFRICGGESSIRDTVVCNKNIRYAKLSGQKKIRVHDFRHSHVSVLANEGINIQEIARRLGHSKVEMTWNTYSHLYPREQEKAVSVLNEIVLLQSTAS
jgi:integrase